jgi:hypothetical protein
MSNADRITPDADRPEPDDHAADAANQNHVVDEPDAVATAREGGDVPREAIVAAAVAIDALEEN